MEKLLENIVHDAAEKAFKKVFSAELAASKFQVNVRPSVAARIGNRSSAGNIQNQIPTPAFVYSMVGGYWPPNLDGSIELRRSVQIDSLSRQVKSVSESGGGYQETVAMDKELIIQLENTGRLLEIDDLLDDYESDLGIYRRIRRVVMSGDP